MDRKTVLTRKKLGLDVPEEYDHYEEPKHLIPASAFVLMAIACFLVGVYCLIYQPYGEDDLILFWFAISFFAAPALLIYPIFRTLFGRNGVLSNVALSSAFGLLIHEKVKSVIKKFDK